MVDAEPGSEKLDCTLEDVLACVRQQTGIDFGPYRASTIQRRALGRMRLAGADDYGAYVSQLARDPAELDRLVSHLTIKVGRFLRDRHVFTALRDRVLPELLRVRPDGSLRIWSAGCGNGEEAYSLALLLAKGGGAFAAARILATDLDRGALDRAQDGRYKADTMADLDPETVAAYFSAEDSHRGPLYVVGERLRAYTQFLWHDLAAADTSPGGLLFDLICCRNVLIYFNRDLQRRVEHLLCASLVPGGFLCLGEAEWPLPEVMEAFTVVDRPARILRLKDGWQGRLQATQSQGRQ